jgi:hypothetical protein
MDSLDFKVNSINAISIEKANGDVIEGIIAFYPSEDIICTITIPDILEGEKNESVNSL